MRLWFMPLLCVLVALPARPAAPQWSGAISASSDYLQHGTSRNYNDPALAAELHMQLDTGLFASLWTSSARLRAVDPRTVEVAATLGFNQRFHDDWSWTGSYTHYDAPWPGPVTWYSYDEFTVDLDWREHLLLSASWSPNTSRFAPAQGLVKKRRAMAWEASYQQALPDNLRVYAGLGYYDLSALFGSGYWYGSAGLGWTWRRWQLDLSGVLPDHAARRLSYPGIARRRAVASLSFIF